MGIYGKQEQEALKRFKEAEDAYREWLHKPIHTGSGLIEQINKRGLNKAPLFCCENFFYFFLCEWRKGKQSTSHPPRFARREAPPYPTRKALSLLRSSYQ